MATERKISTDRKVISVILLLALILFILFYFVEFLPHIGS